MKYKSTLRCSLTPSGSIQGIITSNAALTANFTIPSQIEAETFVGEYEYVPSWDEQVVPTANKLLKTDILIDPIQTYETSNPYGTTFII